MARRATARTAAVCNGMEGAHTRAGRSTRLAGTVLGLLCLLAASAATSPSAGAVGPLQTSAPVHHEIRAALDPVQGTLRVRDTVTLPSTSAAESVRSLHLLLHSGLEPRSVDGRIPLRRESAPPVPAEFFGDPEGTPASLPGAVPTEHFVAELPPGARSLTLEYGGKIQHPVEEAGEEYARGFGVTPGLISDKGVFLSGSSVWYPWLGDNLVTFDLQTETPVGWGTMSQGERKATGGATGWASPEPQDEIYLIAAPWTEYRRTVGGLEIAALLRTPDPALASRYLDATEKYLGIYSKLVGPYPYRKFALVENFWETGYGMPSFTLLGPSILRFPFILNSSYPHEILHNWWGNSVFVDYRSGNWCEGLTAYLADHLLQEQGGQGAEYRQATLQKYADYAARAKDFPLTDFVSRHSAATEAVGYGKALFFFHMLRGRLGDDVFVKGLRRFYEANRFRLARYDDLRTAFEAVAGRDLRGDFQQWVERTGAPSLRVREVQSRKGEGAFRLTGTLEQAQNEEPYRLLVPIAVTLEGVKAAYQTTLKVEGRRTEFRLELPARPLRLDVDPEYDVFRRLDPAETPPAVSGMLGAERVLVVLPAAAPRALLDGYRQLARAWSSDSPGQIEIAEDDQVERLPTGRAVWVFGWENRLRKFVQDAVSSYDCEVREDGVRLEEVSFPRRGHTAVVVGRSPEDPKRPVGWLAVDAQEALPGLGRKLPHYQKWSYLAFEGDEPTNVAKGRWPVVDSPLTVSLGGQGEPVERGMLAPRPALIDPSSSVAASALMEGESFLSSEALKGRALGTRELDRAAAWIAEQFRSAGLQPGGADGKSYFQTWSQSLGDQSVTLKNVIGVLPGTKPEWADQSVVVSAHYDGQGLGLPGGRAEDQGKVHPGADDNASGVAVLLELARALGKTAPGRAVVFAAFTGEELGRLGSRHYVASNGRYPAAKALADVNLDTVGRLGKRKLLILGCGSAGEWVHIFNGAGYAAGVEVECVPADVGGSDQVSFLSAGVPAVQLFSGPHLDYHRPGDTLDRIDAEGLVKVASVSKEVLEYLASRPTPLTVVAGSLSRAGSPGGSGGRKVSLGIVPDFSFQGEGVRLSGVSTGSAAERAGLREGDVLMRVGSTAVRSLKDLSGTLGQLAPGDSVQVDFVRDHQELTAKVRLEAR